jgi:hypothetical protein
MKQAMTGPIPRSWMFGPHSSGTRVTPALNKFMVGVEYHKSLVSNVSFRLINPDTTSIQRPLLARLSFSNDKESK